MATAPPVRVVVGEDQPLVRAGVVRALEEEGFEVVAVAGDAPDLLRKTRAHKPDVVVTDIQMPPTGPMTGCAPRSRSARRCPTSASSCCLSSSRTATPWT